MKIRMRTKILMVCIFCTLTALIVQTVLFQKASSDLIYEQAKEQSYRTLENMQNEIYTYLKSVERTLVKIYNDQEFLRALEDTKNAAAVREKYYKWADTMARTEFASNYGIVAMYIYNIEDEIISPYRKADTPKHNYPKDIYEDEEAYNTAVVKRYVESDDTNMLISSYYNAYRERDIIRLVLKIYDTSIVKDRIGYIVCDLDSGALEKIMEKYVIDEENYIWLQPEGDRPISVLGTLKEENRKDYEEISGRILAGESDTDYFEDKNQILFQVFQKNYNLSAYSLMSESILEKNQKTLTRNLILIACITSAIMVLLYFYVTRSLTEPLEKLMETIARIRFGETTLRVAYQAEDEIGRLGTEFNTMLDEIESLIGQQYEDKLLINKAEYKALQAQINPHFLYNTLDTMSSIASIQNCETVSNLCQSLSNIFRYSLNIKHPYSTVGREIVHLKNYIFVMNVRMRDEVKYQFDIDEEVLSDTIPRISIQPLVENAINHGLKNKHGEKYIRIKASRQEGLLRIIVEDNGVGMNAEEMNRRLKENDRDFVEEGSSIGLMNINARLKMLYGPEYGLRIESRQGDGLCVILEVPAVKEEEFHEKEQI